MLHNPNIRRLSALALMVLSAALLLTTPAFAGAGPSSDAAQESAADASASSVDLVTREGDPVGRAIVLPSGLVEAFASVGGNAGALRELREILEGENTFAPRTAVDPELGAAKGREDPREGLSLGESSRSSFIERAEGTRPEDRFESAPSKGDGRYEAIFGASGIGSPGPGPHPRFSGPGRAGDGTRIGSRGGTTTQDPAPKEVDPSKVVNSYDRSCGQLCNVYTWEYGDGRVREWYLERSPETGWWISETYEWDADGDLHHVTREITDEDGNYIDKDAYFVVTGSPSGAGEEEPDPDEQPSPDPNSGGIDQGCNWSPVYGDCMEDFHRVSPEEKVSQPGGGVDGGAEPSHGGGFRASVQERIDVVTQPSSEGSDLTRGGGGDGDSGAPGGGGPCTVC